MLLLRRTMCQCTYYLKKFNFQIFRCMTSESPCITSFILLPTLPETSRTYKCHTKYIVLKYFSSSVVIGVICQPYIGVCTSTFLCKRTFLSICGTTPLPSSSMFSLINGIIRNDLRIREAKFGVYWWLS